MNVQDVEKRLVFIDDAIIVGHVAKFIVTHAVILLLMFNLVKKKNEYARIVSIFWTQMHKNQQTIIKIITII